MTTTLDLTNLAMKHSRTTEEIYEDAVEFRRQFDAGERKEWKGLLYLAGPMSGYELHNFPMFRKVSGLLKAQGWYVLDPSENFQGAADQSYAVHYLADVRLVPLVDAVAFLPGWQKSSGATGEYMLGDRLDKKLFSVVIKDPDKDSVGGKTVMTLEPLKLDSITYVPFPRNQPDKISLAQQSVEIVNKARMSSYGKPADDFGRATGALSALGYCFKDHTGSPRKLETYDLPIIMNIVKLSRLVNSISKDTFHSDSVLDIHGYMNTLEMLYHK